jgi:hypothetical protein
MDSKSSATGRKAEPVYQPLATCPSRNNQGEPPMTFDYDAFFSFQPEDATAVEAIAGRLRQQAQLQIFLDPRPTLANEPWPAELSQVLDRSATFVDFVGSHAPSPWTHPKLAAALKLLLAALLLFLWFALFSLVLRVSAIQAADYQGRVGPDVAAQLAFIRTRLRRLDGPAIEQLGPVKAVFVHTFYAFSLVNTVLLDPENQVRRSEAIEELKWVLERLRDPAVKQGFSATQVSDAVFYLGERNLTQSAFSLSLKAL